MSDLSAATPTPTVDSAPTQVDSTPDTSSESSPQAVNLDHYDSNDTASIVAEGYNRLTTGERDDDDNTPDEPTNTTEATPISPADELSEAERLLKEAGYDLTGPHRVPLKKAKSIITNALAAGRAKERGDWEAKVTQATKQFETAQATIDQMAAVEQMMQEPERFLQAMAQVNPAYQRYIQQAQATQPPVQREVPAEMPQPDYRLPDGSMTYSVDGLKKRDAWVAQQIESRILQQIAPVTQTVQSWQEAQLREQQKEVYLQQAGQALQTYLNDAETWPGWKENFDDIQKAVREDFKQLPAIQAIDAAYRKVVVGKLSTDRNKVREDVIAEINARPRSTSAPASPSRTQDGPKTTEEIVRAAYERMNRK